jgi:DNA (cytosine-5)-methyltransferase 1
MNIARSLRYLSLCSGIEAATVAWKPLGWTPAAFAEIDKFPSAVLAYHYPTIPNLGDITRISGKDFRGQIDLLIGGTPCQSFSVAGRRKGLADPRGDLTLVFLKILGEARPRWVIWENVPGILSIDGGRTFGTILGQMAKCGYGFAYRILNSVHWRVPQLRRRVYLVGYLGNWRPAAAVLFERQSLSGHTPAGRSQRTKSAGNAAAGPGSHGPAGDAGRLIESAALAPSICAGPPFSRTGNSRVECEALVTQALTCRLGSGGPDDNKAQAGFYVPTVQIFGGNNTSGPIDVSPALNAHGGGSRRLDFESEAFVAQTLKGEGFDGSEDGTGRANLLLTAPDCSPQLAFAQNSRNEVRLIGGDDRTAGCVSGREGMKQKTYVASVAIRGRDGGAAAELGLDVATALRAPQGGGDKVHILHNLAVRRMTPLECERLQYFPDNYTLIPWRGKPAASCPDGPRYKAIGNSMTVSVIRWVGERLAWVENLMAG